jgi:hypothetical protein
MSDIIHATGYNGQVEFDGAFVTINRKGALARMSVGKGTKRIPVTSISAIQLKPAGKAINGFIQFTLAGGNERRSRFGSQTTTAGKDENSVVFTKRHQDEFETLQAAIEAVIAAPAQPTSGGVADEIAKLAVAR